MNPENKIFAQHDLDRISTKALNHQKKEELLNELLDTFSNPDAVEDVPVGILGNFENPLVKINNFLSVIHKLTLGRSIRAGIQNPARIELFNPYETVVSQEHFGTEFATSIISSNVYDAYSNKELVGKIVLFKLDHASSKLTSKDIEIGNNCTFGALIINGEIKPFRLSMQEDEDKVLQQVERKDPTEEGGMAVDSRLVAKGSGIKNVQIHELDIDKDAEEYLEVMNELDKFIDHRKQLRTE